MSLGGSFDLRENLWDSMLTAHLNYRYWSELASRYLNFDKSSKIFLAIASSTTVATWAFWQDAHTLWKILSAISALMAIALPFLNLQDYIKRMTSLRVEWFRTMKSYEAIFLKYETGQTTEIETRNEYVEISTGESELIEDATGLPVRIKLLNKCQLRVLESRGLKN